MRTSRVLLSEEFKLPTTISTYKVSFYYKRLLFGISIGPSVFQKWKQHYREFLSIETIQERIARLEKESSRLENASFVLPAKNVYFSRKPFLIWDILYLDKDDPWKWQETFQAISKAPCPENKHQLMAYLGLYNRCRTLIPNNMASIAYALYQLEWWSYLESVSNLSKWFWGFEENYSIWKCIILRFEITIYFASSCYWSWKTIFYN